jgi:hypothetical protein
MIDRADDPDRRFRSTAEWQRIAARMRAADPLCTFCGMLGIAKAGDVVDHMHQRSQDTSGHARRSNESAAAARFLTASDAQQLMRCSG